MGMQLFDPPSQALLVCYPIDDQPFGKPPMVLADTDGIGTLSPFALDLASKRDIYARVILPKKMRDG